jgi:hypothetical protein
MNPYEPPQAIDTPPLPSAIEQTHLEQVSFRNLSEIAWSFAVPGQIMVTVLLVALVLVGVTWNFYTPGNNPNWVTIVMLGCGSVIAVLVCWHGILASLSYSTLNKYVRLPPLLSVRAQKAIILCLMFGSMSAAPILMEFRHQVPGGKSLLLLPFSICFPGIWLAMKQHAQLFVFLRSFLPQGMSRQSSCELRKLSLAGAASAMVCLFVMNLESVPGSIAWGWLLLALAGAIVYVMPFAFAYRQLAREFDKRWP